MTRRCVFLVLLTLLLAVTSPTDVPQADPRRRGIAFAREADAWDQAERTGLHVLIMVPCACKDIEGPGSDIAATWASTPAAQKFASVKLVVGSSAQHGHVQNCLSTAPEPHRQRLRDMLLHLPHCPDQQAPDHKVLCMWEYARRGFAGKYSHYMKAEPDAYVNVLNLVGLLNEVDPREAHWVGSVASGPGVGGPTAPRSDHPAPYCSGFGYVLTDALVAALPDGLADPPTEAVPHGHSTQRRQASAGQGPRRALLEVAPAEGGARARATFPAMAAARSCRLRGASTSSGADGPPSFLCGRRRWGPRPCPPAAPGSDPPPRPPPAAWGRTC